MHWILVLFVHYFSQCRLFCYYTLIWPWRSFQPYFFFYWYSYLYFFFGFLFSVPFVAVASLHPLTQVCISILTVVFCYSVGAVLIFLSDLLSLFFSWHSALVVFFLPWDLLDWFSLWICCLLCSVYYLWQLLFTYLPFIYATFLISSFYHYGIVVLWA